jgi:hypothetical protein
LAIAFAGWHRFLACELSAFDFAVADCSSNGLRRRRSTKTMTRVAQVILDRPLGEAKRFAAIVWRLGRGPLKAETEILFP